MFKYETYLKVIIKIKHILINKFVCIFKRYFLEVFLFDISIEKPFQIDTFNINITNIFILNIKNSKIK